MPIYIAPMNNIKNLKPAVGFKYFHVWLRVVITINDLQCELHYKIYNSYRTLEILNLIENNVHDIFIKIQNNKV